MTPFSASDARKLASSDDATTALLFPGQGSQTPDMRDHVAQRCPDLLERCIELVGEDPFARVEESTRFQQPAIFCASIAGWRELPDDVKPGAAAGHSLGELAALAAAGVLTVDDALELVVLRGRLMAEADDRGSMIALVGADEAEAAKVAEAAGLIVANDNAPGQVVISGGRDALLAVEEPMRAAGAKRIVRLPVSGAFHSPLMAAVAEALAEAFAAESWREPAIPVMSNLTAEPESDPDRIRALLAEQVRSPVEWVRCVERMVADGVDTMIECGAGAALVGMVRRIAPDVRTGTVTDTASLGAAAVLLTPAQVGS
jgi:[acyl-carrier-protein] S-malonyltransferase